MDVAGAGFAPFGRVAGGIIIGEVGHHHLIAHHIVGIHALGGEELEPRHELAELTTQRPVFEHFGRLDVAGNELWIARHVVGALLVESHGLVAEHHVVVGRCAADDERQQFLDGGNVAENVGDVLVGDGGGDLIIVWHNLYLVESRPARRPPRQCFGRRQPRRAFHHFNRPPAMKL